MLLSPITSSNPPLSLPGCKTPSIKLPVRPSSARSTSYSSIPLAKHSTPASAALDIPSPPLTPHLGYECDQADGLHDDDDGIFSSRFRRQRDRQQSEKGISFRHSSSAPSDMSPLMMRASTSVPTGFTFSSNIPANQAKEDRDSYDIFLNTMEEDYWKSVSTIRTTYFFDGIGRGGGFLAIPHLASHGNAKTNIICRLLEAWLTKKLVEPTISDSIPVLEDNIQSSVQSIEQHLRSDPKVWAGISKSFIHIRCGHVFMLDTCCDDETIVHLGADEFYQDYPLFVDVEIKMHCDSNQVKENQTEILIAFQNVVSRKATKESDKPFVHRATICDLQRRRSSLDVEASSSA